MTQSGSSLLSMIQNTETPILDLFVRESVQNSLDAHKDGVPFVKVDFLTGSFNKECFNKELDKISDALNKRYPEKEYHFLAIKDTNTVGLTGPVDEENVIDEQYGNLLKLVYQISKPQEQQGAGGSWGIGKTVYFRVGIGLVIYYSQFENQDGETEERLAVTLVEDEKSKDALIPHKGTAPRRGIAWWGEASGKNKTKPLEKPSDIKRILKCFGLSPFEENETGTLVIIPFIDEKKICTVHSYKGLEDSTKHQIPFWCNDISEYLRIAIERWYCPRLNNKEYPFGPYLQVFINGTKIIKSKMEPVFRLYHDLYRYAFNPEEKEELSFKFQTEKIRIFKYLKSPETGILVFGQIPKEYFKTDFRPDPVIYINKTPDSEDYNRPVVAYTRQPGMIVDYENIGKWVKDIPVTTKDTYIFGLFVLNSKNILRDHNPETTLEQYIRKSENADHIAWGDHTRCENYSAPIVELVQNKVSDCIKKCYSEKKDPTEGKRNNSLSIRLGKMLLPPMGFGKAASQRKKSGSSSNGGSGITKGKLSMYIDSENVQYSTKIMTVPINILSQKKFKTGKFGINLLVELESSNVTVFDWERNMGLVSPFDISQVDIVIKKVDEIEKDESILLSHKNEIVKIDEGEVTLLNTNSNKGCGIEFKFSVPHSIEMNVSLALLILNSEYRPSFSLVTEKEVNNG